MYVLASFLNITENIDYFLVVFFFAGAGFLHAPFVVFAEVPHFFVAIQLTPFLRL